MPRVLTRKKPGRNIELYYVDSLSGREITKSSKTRDQKRAERAAADWERELSLDDGSGRVRWHVAREKFEQYLAHSVSEVTREQYLLCLDRFEELIGSPRDLSAIKPLILDDFVNKLRAIESIKSDATLGNQLKGLRIFLKWCESRQLIVRAPRMPMPKGWSKPKPRGKPISNEQFATMLALFPKRWRTFVRGLWLSGLRSSEAVALHWENGPVRLDLENERIEFEVEGHKGRRQESAPITGDFVAFLKSLPGRTGPVLPSPCADSNGIGKGFRRIRKKLDFKCTPHDFRRSFGTRWAAKLNHAELQAIMRHRDIKTTLGYYVQFTADQIANSVRAKTAPESAPKLKVRTKHRRKRITKAR